MEDYQSYFVFRNLRLVRNELGIPSSLELPPRRVFQLNYREPNPYISSGTLINQLSAHSYCV
jgi:hypothetical protein